MPWMAGQRMTVAERIERSLLRMERLNLRTLSLLQRMAGEPDHRTGSGEHPAEDALNNRSSPSTVGSATGQASSLPLRGRHRTE